MPPWMDDDLEERRRRGLYRVRRRLASGQGPRVLYRGREFVNFSSNDYLALAGDPRLARAAAAAARRYGCGAGASPLVSGHLPPLRALERALARWEGTEAALVFSSGFAANLALVAGLAGREDAVFSDARNHASLIDGCRLSRAGIHVYRHADLAHLADLLSGEAGRARRRLIVTDTVFSMDGDLAPLAGLLDLAERFDALLLSDEAHATGVIGPGGRGVSELLPVARRHSDRLVKVGTLSKALGAQGGFVCGSRQLVRWLVNHARPYIFSTALAPPVAAAARAALALVQAEPEWRGHLLALAERLREGLRALGYDVGDSRCHIIPVIVGGAREAVALSARLEEHGLLVPAIRPPSVPEGTARLRISLTAGHTEADVTRLLTALRRLRGTTAPRCRRGEGSA
ncbi:MAG TPA: 8-amino-7-oxononanoate synthase [Gemmataceae bacterium]|nr:8-amino-7-oxononanoate synthase [Gemmataceae bacterium]